MPCNVQIVLHNIVVIDLLDASANNARRGELGLDLVLQAGVGVEDFEPERPLRVPLAEADQPLQPCKIRKMSIRPNRAAMCTALCPERMVARALTPQPCNTRKMWEWPVRINVCVCMGVSFRTCAWAYVLPFTHLYQLLNVEQSVQTL